MKISKISSILILYRKFISELTFQDFLPAASAAAAAVGNNAVFYTSTHTRTRTKMWAGRVELLHLSTVQEYDF